MSLVAGVLLFLGGLWNPEQLLEYICACEGKKVGGIGEGEEGERERRKEGGRSEGGGGGGGGRREGRGERMKRSKWYHNAISMIM